MGTNDFSKVHLCLECVFLTPRENDKLLLDHLYWGSFLQITLRFEVSYMHSNKIMAGLKFYKPWCSL
jgi:hypothetical protein